MTLHIFRPWKTSSGYEIRTKHSRIRKEENIKTFPENQHPRLYFSREDLPSLRRAAQLGPRGQLLKRLRNWCDRFLDPKDEYYFDFRERCRPIWKMRDVCHTWQASMHMLSFCYAFTNEERYGVSACDALLNCIETKLADDAFDGSEWNRNYEGWRRSTLHSHDKGLYAWAVCNSYDLCHDLLSESQRTTVRDHIIESIHILDDPKLYANTMQFLTNNRGARAMIGVRGMYPLAIEGEIELPQIEGYLGEAIYAAEAFLNTAFDQDGVSYEGPSYAVGSINTVYAFAKMLARSGRANLLRNPFWERFAQHQLYELLPGGSDLNNLNDCDPLNGSVQSSMFLMGSERGAILPWLAQQLDLHPRRQTEQIGHVINVWWVDLMFPSLLWEWRDDVPVRTPQELGYPLSRCFPQRGIASMRTGWRAQDILLSHKCGYEMYGQHRQSDQNHIALYALGERFLVDEGYNDQADVVTGTSRGEENFRYFSRADLHNTVLFDGVDQNGNMAHGGWTRWADGRIIDWQHTPAFDTSLGDASRAYGKDRAIRKALRRVVFVRDATHPFVIVIDAMDVNGDGCEHEYEALWRTAKTNRIELNGNRFTIVGEKNDCHGAVLFPSSAELVVKTHFNLSQLRVKVRAGILEMVTFFVPVCRGEQSPLFTCERNGEGDFTITVHGEAKQHMIRAGTRTEGPLHTPVPVEVR